MVEFVEILCDSISTLFELHKFFLLHMEHPFRNIVLPKSQFEFVPGNLMTRRLDSHIISPPSAGRGLATAAPQIRAFESRCIGEAQTFVQ
jgi:hypothetical protein